MAASEQLDSPKFSLNSYQTAVAIVPPAYLVDHVNTLRAAYDKTYDKWPAHINVLYPFVHPDLLDAATQRLRVFMGSEDSTEIRLQLDSCGSFASKQGSTIHLKPSQCQSLLDLQSRLHTSIAKGNATEWKPHMTVGQAGPGNSELKDALLAKVALLKPVEWNVGELVIFQRDSNSRMKVWQVIPIGNTASSIAGPAGLKTESQALQANSLDEDDRELASRSTGLPVSRGVQRGTTYRFDTSVCAWRPLQISPSLSIAPGTMQASFSISSYNILIDSVYPPPRHRFPLLIRNILSRSAVSSVLVLQEVSDEFLDHLLGNAKIRALYPYTTHAPACDSTGPLLSLRNIVILSRRSFDWEYVPFDRRHKGAVVVRLHHTGFVDGGQVRPLIVAGIHLTCGLTDGSVAAKTGQLRTLIRFLATKYPKNAWAIAGDFNMTTSQKMLKDALQDGTISPQTAQALADIRCLLDDHEIQDVWEETASPADDSLPGEEGATFDPLHNPLAAAIVGYGTGHRPQRYDRVLLRGSDNVTPCGFNVFGTSFSPHMTEYASDHWGVRAILQLVSPSKASTAGEESIVPGKELPLEADTALASIVASHHLMPSSADLDLRASHLKLVRSVLFRISTGSSKVALAVVPVGSYGLDVWNRSSDLDILCIGTISAKTFFALAIQTIQNVAEQDSIRVVRKVVAQSGTMLELDVHGTHVDLQYCAAGRIAESWPNALIMPASDPLFAVPHQTLLKLKAVRDMVAVQETTPSFQIFVAAYRYLVFWAMARGIYAARFGFLGGSHIVMLLNRVVKLLYSNKGLTGPRQDITSANVVSTFFKYYAAFDWKRSVVEDPQVRASSNKRPYMRRLNEPIVILGFHAPNINLARQATVPTVRTITDEMNRAASILESLPADFENPGSLWTAIAASSTTTGSEEFLQHYEIYAQLTVQYWGKKGKELLGWLESRLPALLVELNRKLPDHHARLWPQRLTQDDHSEHSDGNTRQACYLIGIEQTANLSKAHSELDAEASPTLDHVLRAFADQLREHDKHPDVRCTWLSVDQARQAELGTLHLDEREWGQDVFQDDFSDLDDDAEDFIDETALEFRSTPELNDIERLQTPVIGKLRPASDVLHRLRWDPELSSSDYVVGYTDRFLGAKEIALDKWKLEQTDEEFIPQHRIVYFKDRRSGVRVWDRERRIDEVFRRP